jgi:hypothetical protein
MGRFFEVSICSLWSTGRRWPTGPVEPIARPWRRTLCLVAIRCIRRHGLALSADATPFQFTIVEQESIAVLMLA